MHGDVEKSKATKSNNNRIQRGNFYSSMTNGGQGIVSPVLSSLDPVDANYKGCILFVSIDRDDFKSELLSKENFHSTPSPLMNFPFRPMTTVLFSEVLCLVTRSSLPAIRHNMASEQMLPPELGLLLETAKSLSLLSRKDFSVLLTMIIGKPLLQWQSHICLGT